MTFDDLLRWALAAAKHMQTDIDHILQAAEREDRGDTPAEDNPAEETPSDELTFTPRHPER